MNRAEFVEKFKNASDDTDYEYHSKIINASIDVFESDDKFRGETNLIIAMEEFGELIQEVSKKLRGEESNIGVLEEAADALLCIQYIQLICGITNEDLRKAMNVKIDRLAEKLDLKEKDQPKESSNSKQPGPYYAC